MLRTSPEVLADRVVWMVEHAMIKFLAERRKEDGHTTHLLMAITGGSRRLLDRQQRVEKDDYREAAECFEELPLAKAIFTQPAAVTLDNWRRYLERAACEKRA